MRHGRWYAARMAGDKLSSNPQIDGALKLDGDPQSVSKYYRDWADTYDRDTAASAYSGPRIAADLLARHVSARQLILLDAGCGTGQVGAALRPLGFERIDGFDLSEPMAERARATGAYREVLGDIDMMRARETYADSSYDGVLSVGVFTLGHVPPEALRVLAAIVRPGGWLLVSVRTHYYDESEFQPLLDAETDAGGIEIVEALMDAPYNHDGNGHYWLLRRIC